MNLLSRFKNLSFEPNLSVDSKGSVLGCKERVEKGAIINAIPDFFFHGRAKGWYSTGSYEL
jgi:hypothetical protein